jgi:hypothetical protein
MDYLKLLIHDKKSLIEVGKTQIFISQINEK